MARKFRQPEVPAKPYNAKIGDWLINNAKTAGHLIAKLRYTYKLKTNDLDSWKNPDHKNYSPDFCDKLAIAMDIRKDFYFELAKTSKMDKVVFSMMMWTEFKDIVNSPREISSKSEVNMEVGAKDLNHIVESLQRVGIKDNGFG